LHKIDEKWLCRADFGELKEYSYVSEELEGRSNDFGELEKTSFRSAFGTLEKMSYETGVALTSLNCHRMKFLEKSAQKSFCAVF